MNPTKLRESHAEKLALAKEWMNGSAEYADAFEALIERGAFKPICSDQWYLEGDEPQTVLLNKSRNKYVSAIEEKDDDTCEEGRQHIKAMAETIGALMDEAHQGMGYTLAMCDTTEADDSNVKLATARVQFAMMMFTEALESMLTETKEMKKRAMFATLMEALKGSKDMDPMKMLESLMEDD